MVTNLDDIPPSPNVLFTRPEGGQNHIELNPTFRPSAPALDIGLSSRRRRKPADAIRSDQIYRRLHPMIHQ